MGASLVAPTRSGVVTAQEWVASWEETAGEGWSLEGLRGRFVEVSGAASTAALTAVAGLVLEAQRRGGLAAWVGREQSSFFPPDFAAMGIDLDALPVVRAHNAMKAARVADALLRSGGFSIVVLDLGRDEALPLAIQTRFVGLAKKHRTALVCVTRKGLREPRESGGSLVSLRGETEKRRAGADCFVCEVRAVKDKRREPGWTHTEVCRGSDGLC